MSLKVPADLQAKAEAGDVTDADFIQCIQDSLPYAWSVVTSVADSLKANGGPFADNQEEPPTEEARGQLLRLVGSDAMRGAVERHFGVRLAFQNCHRLALFSPDAAEQYAIFTSPRAQLLNQKPELVNC
ncbi:SCO5389 family protein [Amycolatopsis cynarae]|uniref:SCO5389 family protein n=1 Tax=Amycolatopsis cynarae TaxID=2995223 RepID=A0ABY7B2V0_9PSEU|nr:SCO5389 family protein [Amycolatopsis sp. HUAS 11-8]WAL66630.1 SCO5389 family protein [Amycolatopsis sp. HUAS 11-8]